MRTIKQIIASALVALSVVVGGVVASAPAQAASNTSVYFILVDSPYDADLQVTKMNNTVQRLNVGSTATSVKKICPPTNSYKIHLRTPRGSYVTYAPGTCTNTGLAGRYQVTLIRV